MIKIKKTWIGGFEGALRGMRNPYESHEKSDSVNCYYDHSACQGCERLLETRGSCTASGRFYIGKADMTLCKRLILAGPEHRKFLRMIHVQADVTAPRYWWAEMDKYKWVEANSSSTMHLITKRDLTIDDFSHDPEYNEIDSRWLWSSIDRVNDCIHEYNLHSDKETKDYWFRKIKQFLPESYNQLRTIDTNYEALLSIHHQRHNHRLTEWRKFCEWIESLPYMGEFLEVSSDGQSESRT